MTEIRQKGPFGLSVEVEEPDPENLSEGMVWIRTTMTVHVGWVVHVEPGFVSLLPFDSHRKGGVGDYLQHITAHHIVWWSYTDTDEQR